MKIFRKTHFWKDNRTFIEVDATEASKERGFAKEGNLLLKIGEQSSTKAAFKLSPDEARALRDSIDMFLRFHDMKLSEFMTDQQDQYQKVPDYYPRDTTSFRKEVEPNPQPQSQEATQPFFLFDNAEQKKPEESNEQRKPNSEFYF